MLSTKRWVVTNMKKWKCKLPQFAKTTWAPAVLLLRSPPPSATYRMIKSPGVASSRSCLFKSFPKRAVSCPGVSLVELAQRRQGNEASFGNTHILWSLASCNQSLIDRISKAAKIQLARNMGSTKTGGRILSIQSHVVRGYVGNKSATFPLQVSCPFSSLMTFTVSPQSQSMRHQ